MQGWVFVDDDSREVLARAGLGRVTAVAADPEGGYRVEIDCVRPRSASRAIRFSVHAVVADPSAALAALASGTVQSWTVEWHRRAGVPASVSILSLDLASDARGVLVTLEDVEPSLVDADLLAR